MKTGTPRVERLDPLDNLTRSNPETDSSKHGGGLATSGPTSEVLARGRIQLPSGSWEWWRQYLRGNLGSPEYSDLQIVFRHEIKRRWTIRVPVPLLWSGEPTPLELARRASRMSIAEEFGREMAVIFLTQHILIRTPRPGASRLLPREGHVLGEMTEAEIQELLRP